jgi:L-cysteine:1D-myo-inositol 2-amino-2-deoxy-alpha-D-glucopyranoside ligase
MVGLDGEKMSKSKGNLVFVSALRRDGCDPMVIRLALLAHHYRGDWEWTAGDLTAGQRRLDRWREALRLPRGPDGTQTLEAVRRALADDLDAPAALAAIDVWVADALAGGGADESSPRLVAATADALLGVHL